MRRFLILFFAQWIGLSAVTFASTFMPIFPPCDPVSDFLKPAPSSKEPSLQFCAKWNPEFDHNGKRCCSVPTQKSHKGRRKRHGCVPGRARSSYCSEMTAQQKEYLQAVKANKFDDLLSLISQEMGKKGEQSFCSSGNGFLAFGRMIIPTDQNRILVQSPEKCLNFGTDAMVAMLEWLGREVGKNYSEDTYSKVRIVLGDVSAPKGGCLSNSSGRRRHASHTTGQDADIGFLTAKPNQASPTRFHRQFDLKTNWWFIRRIFKNPFACVKVIFLDRKHIHSLEKFARGDSEWKFYNRFIRHMPGHKNHLHVRIGNGPGQPGCSPDAHPELEFEEDSDTIEANEQAILDELKSRQSSGVEE